MAEPRQGPRPESVQQNASISCSQAVLTPLETTLERVQEAALVAHRTPLLTPKEVRARLRVRPHLGQELRRQRLPDSAVGTAEQPRHRGVSTQKGAPGRAGEGL